MTRTTPIAVLPMYDWPHIREQTDAFWAILREGLIGAGIQAPQSLSRPSDPMTAWRSPQLVLGQTCGLPYVTELRHSATLIGTPDYGVPGCPPGWYRSAIVARRDDARDTVSEFRGSVLAVNSWHSQSGWQAIAQALPNDAGQRSFFAGTAVTGSHAASISHVAAGDADVAAIDFVSWRLAQQAMTQCERLRVVDLTCPMPGLPLIAHRDCCRAAVSDAVEQAIESLPEHTGRALGLCGFWRSEPSDYDIIARTKRNAA